jgi:hypothetical protein
LAYCSAFSSSRSCLFGLAGAYKLTCVQYPTRRTRAGSIGNSERASAGGVSTWPSPVSSPVAPPCIVRPCSRAGTARHNKLGEWIPTFAIITTDANELVANIHDRMPIKPLAWRRRADRIGEGRCVGLAVEQRSAFAFAAPLGFLRGSLARSRRLLNSKVLQLRASFQFLPQPHGVRSSSRPCIPRPVAVFDWGFPALQ